MKLSKVFDIEKQRVRRGISRESCKDTDEKDGSDPTLRKEKFSLGRKGRIAVGF